MKEISALMLCVRTNKGQASIQGSILDMNRIEIYPIPFDKYLQIDFELTQSAEVQIELYDLTGKRIAILLNEYKPAGVNTIQWSPNNSGAYLPAGAYFIRTSIGDEDPIIRKVIKTNQ